MRAILRSSLYELAKASGNASKRQPSLNRHGKTQVVWTLNHAFQDDSSPLDNAEALDTLLRCLTAINVAYLLHRPGIVPHLYNSGVIYDRTVVWDSIPALFARRYGDCKSVSCALVAQYQVQGIPARNVFRWIRPAPDQTNFHILTQVPWGFEDPSKVLGMGRNENSYFQRTG